MAKIDIFTFLDLATLMEKASLGIAAFCERHFRRFAI